MISDTPIRNDTIKNAISADMSLGATKERSPPEGLWFSNDADCPRASLYVVINPLIDISDMRPRTERSHTRLYCPRAPSPRRAHEKIKNQNAVSTGKRSLKYSFCQSGMIFESMLDPNDLIMIMRRMG